MFWEFTNRQAVIPFRLNSEYPPMQLFHANLRETEVYFVSIVNCADEWLTGHELFEGLKTPNSKELPRQVPVIAARFRFPSSESTLRINVGNFTMVQHSDPYTGNADAPCYLYWFIATGCGQFELTKFSCKAQKRVLSDLCARPDRIAARKERTSCSGKQRDLAPEKTWFYALRGYSMFRKITTL